MEKYENLERFVNYGIKQAICEPDPNQSINIILEFLGKALNGERMYIFERNSSGGHDNTYEWTAEGVAPKQDNLRNLPPEVWANWYHYFNKNKSIIVDDIEEMRHNDSLVYETLKSWNIHSIVVIPLYEDNQATGFYGIGNPARRDLDYAFNMLQIVGYFISSMIKRRDMMNQLREISLLDQLTRLGNRYAMYEYISNVRGGKGLGVVYCDITGLKRTNDTMGHEMGDRLICHAAESLKSAFEEYGLFRIGGDELLVICADIDEAAMQERTALLRRKAAENSVNLAIGTVWVEKFDNNMQELMRKAEQLMYQEKSEYYRSAGMDRRR